MGEQIGFAIGDSVFDARLPGSSPEQIALFSVATEDPNPIHVDKEFAAASGFPNIIQQGPMTTAQFARLLKEHLVGYRLQILDVTFTAPVFPMESLRLTGTVTSVEPELVVELSATKEGDIVTAKGFATAMAAP